MNEKRIIEQIKEMSDCKKISYIQEIMNSYDKEMSNRLQEYYEHLNKVFRGEAVNKYVGEKYFKSMRFILSACIIITSIMTYISEKEEEKLEKKEENQRWLSLVHTYGKRCDEVTNIKSLPNLTLQTAVTFEQTVRKVITCTQENNTKINYLYSVKESGLFATDKYVKLGDEKTLERIEK